MFCDDYKALTWREILKILEIEPKDDTLKILDQCPEILTDDGMGYGVQESWVVEVDKEYNRLWREHKSAVTKNKEYHDCIDHLRKINHPWEKSLELLEKWERGETTTNDIMSLK